MRAFDVTGVGALLVLVPLFAWWIGRLCGRRDWRISSLLLMLVLVTIALQVDVLAVMALHEGRVLPLSFEDFLIRLGRRIVEAGQQPEFPVFLLIFGCFVGMLGWSSIPADKKS